MTLDGRYFFFTSNRKSGYQLPPGMPPARSMPGSGSRDIYWMKAEFLEQGSPDGARQVDGPGGLRSSTL